MGLIADATKRGYRFALGGEPPGGPGYFLPVTIIDDPPEDARIVQEDSLARFLPLLKFDDIDDVVARANATDYGLGSSVWSGDQESAEAVGPRLQRGMVWINESPMISHLAPFGGHKQVGIGRLKRHRRSAGLHGAPDHHHP